MSNAAHYAELQTLLFAPLYSGRKAPFVSSENGPRSLIAHVIAEGSYAD